MTIICMLVLKKNMRSLTMLFIFIIFFLNTKKLAYANSSIEDEKWSETLMHIKSSSIYVDVSSDQADLFLIPNAKSSWGKVAWTQSLPIDISRISDAPVDWVPIKGTNGKKQSKGNGPRPDVWINRHDVVLPNDYKRVVGCWPVKSVTYVAGDYAVDVKLEINGNAMIKEWGEDSSINKKNSEKVHVYIYNSMIILKSEKKNGPTFFTSGYRSDERRLYPNGVPAKAQELVSNSLLAECKSVPLVEAE